MGSAPSRAAAVLARWEEREGGGQDKRDGVGLGLRLSRVDPVIRGADAHHQSTNHRVHTAQDQQIEKRQEGGGEGLGGILSRPAEGGKVRPLTGLGTDPPGCVSLHPRRRLAYQGESVQGPLP